MTDAQAWRRAQRAKWISASVAGLAMLLVRRVLDPPPTRLELVVLVILAMIAGGAVGFVVAAALVRPDGPPLRGPTRTMAQRRTTIGLACVLALSFGVVLSAIGLATSPLPLAAVLIPVPICALLAGEFVGRHDPA